MGGVLSTEADGGHARAHRSPVHNDDSPSTGDKKTREGHGHGHGHRHHDRHHGAKSRALHHSHDPDPDGDGDGRASTRGRVSHSPGRNNDASSDSEGARGRSREQGEASVQGRRSGGVGGRDMSHVKSGVHTGDGSGGGGEWGGVNVKGRHTHSSSSHHLRKGPGNEQQRRRDAADHRKDHHSHQNGEKHSAAAGELSRANDAIATSTGATAKRSRDVAMRAGDDPGEAAMFSQSSNPRHDERSCREDEEARRLRATVERLENELNSVRFGTSGAGMAVGGGGWGGGGAAGAAPYGADAAGSPWMAGGNTPAAEVFLH